MRLGETQTYASPEEAVKQRDPARFFDQGADFIEHHGVKGMKWGVRKDNNPSGLRKSSVPGVPAKTDRMAKKDAVEFTKAKQFYGPGAGNRRKLIKATVEERSKDPLYKKAFDHHVANTDMAKRSKQAKRQRKRIDRTDTVKKTARKTGITDLVRDAAVNKILEQSDSDLDVLMADGNSMVADILEHHGVKGMKWGVRKEDKGGGDGNVGVVDPVSVAIVSMYAAMAIGVAVHQYRYSKDGGEKIADQNKDVAWKKKPELSKKMNADELHKNVVKQVNPDFPAKGTKMNCRRCTLTYEMRRRGYDVEATKSRYAKGQDAVGIKEALNHQKVPHESVWGQKQIATPHMMMTSKPDERGKHVFDALNKEPDGARGELGVGWFPFGGHSMAWEKVDGKAHIFDAQSGKKYSDPVSMRELTHIMHDAAYTRTDNAKLNDQFIRRWVINNEH